MFWYVFIQLEGGKKQVVILKRSGFQIGNIRCENKTEYSCKNFYILVSDRKYRNTQHTDI